jgi:hypothetical protein
MRSSSPRPGYKCHPDAGHGTTCRMIDVLRFVVELAPSWCAAAPVSWPRTRCFGSSSSWRSERSRGGSGGHRGSASRWGWPHTWRRRGTTPRCSSSRRPFSAGTGQASGRSGDDALGRRVDPRRRGRRLSERWPEAIRAGVPSASAVSYSSSASGSAREPSSGTCGARDPGATGNAAITTTPEPRDLLGGTNSAARHAGWQL